MVFKSSINNGGGSGGAVDSVNGQTGVVVLDTGDIAEAADANYVSDAQLVVIGNTSGTNTGDQASIVGITGTKAQFDTAVTDGNFLYVGDVTQYTDEMAQDATGAMVTDGSLVYVDATPLLTRGALTGDITAPQGSNTTTLATVNANVGSFTNANVTVNAKGLITAAANGSPGGTPVDITVANEATDTTCFPAFFTAATGDLGPKTNAGLTFNSNTASLGCTTFVGALTGNVTGNVSGTAATVTTAAQPSITSVGTLTTLTVDDITINGNTISSSGASTLAITPAAGQTITFDGTVTLDAGVIAGATSITSTTFVGALTGNASTATSATTSTNVTVANEATDTTCFPLFSTAATGDLPPKSNASFTFNSSTGLLSSTSLGGTLTTAAQTNITSVGTLTGGATGSGFTVALGSSTITGQLALANGGTGANLSDPNADRIMFWDDSAGTTAYLTLGNGFTITGTIADVDSASTTVDGIVELATAAETTTGTDATRAVTPDGLAGSDYGKRVVGVLASDPAGSAITTGDGKAVFTIPSAMNGWNLVEVAMSVSTVSSSGIPTVQLRRSRRASATTRTDADMLSTKLTVDAGEFSSVDATTAAVIDAANDDVNTGDMIFIDFDVAGTGTKGVQVVLTFQLP